MAIATHRYAVTGLLGLMLIGLSISVEAQMVGPVAPRESGSTEAPSVGKLKNSFKKLFETKTDEEMEAEAEAKKQQAEEENVPGSPQLRPTDSKTPKYTRPPLLTQPPLQQAQIDTPEISEDNPPPEMPTMDNPENPLGITDAEKRLNSIASLIDNGQFIQARSMLVPLKEWLVESTEAHIGLYKVLNRVPTAKAQAQLEKQLALTFALLRDKAFLQMGQIYIAENNHRKAIKELTEVVKSQPRSESGVRAYELLQEIGFTQKLQLAQ